MNIGVFDSGIGGLTVLKALKNRWPHENFVYLADTARLPYGSKSLGTIHKYSQTSVDFLKEFNLKAIVIACNSASAAHIEIPVKCDVPLLNVIEPGARKACETSRNGHIGILGTRATVQSEAYVHALKRLDPKITVTQQACPLWVPLVEEGWIDDPVTNLIVYRYLAPILKTGVDTLVMGCTHYPVLRSSIQKAAGNSISLVDSSDALIEDLENLKLIQPSEKTGSIKILCTDFSPRLEETVRYVLGEVKYDSLEIVDL